MLKTLVNALKKEGVEEIEALGYDRVETMDGRVTFAGDEEAVALANVNLRYAERGFILLGSFSKTALF